MVAKKASKIVFDVSSLPNSVTSSEMLTKQLKAASKAAVQRLRTTHSGINILSTKISAQPALVSLPLSSSSPAKQSFSTTLVDEKAYSQILMNTISFCNYTIR
jgi:hypothetical protein